MSDPGPTPLPFALALQAVLNVSMSALAIVEFLTTLDQEVSAVWRRKRSGASLLLLAIRYTMFFSATLYVYPVRTLDNLKGCNGLMAIREALTLLTVLMVAAFSSLRVYALCGGNIILSAVAFVLQLPPFVSILYMTTASTTLIDPTIGCAHRYRFDKMKMGTPTKLLYASRSSTFAGDILVVIVTWIKSFQQLRAQRRLGISLPLSALIFRDGTAYFLLLLVLNVLEMCHLTATSAGIVISAFVTTFPLILVNRFMLNLRQLSDNEAQSTGRLHTISTPMFRASIDIVGNMGEALEHISEARDGDDEPEIEEVRRDAEGTGLGIDGRDVGEAGV